MYNNFTIEDSNCIGKNFTAVCEVNYQYEKSLTIGKEYTLTIVERILPTSPLCCFVDDKGKTTTAHLSRFTKKGKNNDKID